MRHTSVMLAAALVSGLFIAGSAGPGVPAPPDPDWAACNNGQDHDASIAGCTRIIDRGDRERATGRAHAFRNRADAYYRKGDADRAIQDADAAIRLDPNLAGAYNTRGHAYFARRDYDRAIQDYGAAIRLNPNVAIFYANRGAVLVRQGAVDRALRDADEAIRLNPKLGAGYDLRGNAYLEKHDDDRAIQGFGEAIRLDPTDAVAYSGRGAAYREKGDFEQAMSDLESAIHLNPNLARGYLHRGLVFHQRGDKERAIADLRRALELAKIEAVAVMAREALAKIAAESMEQAPATPTPSAQQALPEVPERRVALVIGNGAYRSAPELFNPVNDATDMAAALRGLGFDVVEGTNLDRYGMDDAVRAFGRKVDRTDLALFFYAGHGLQVAGRNYLVPIDAKLERAGDVNFDTIDVSFVLTLMEAEKRVNLVFLDACRDNPLARTLARSLGTRSASVGHGLASVHSALGTMIAYATEPDNVALDGEGRNSPFTSALLRHIGDKGVDIGTVMRRVRAEVVAATHEKQVPWDHSSLVGEVYLAR